MKPVDGAALDLPVEIREIIGGAALFESSGASGAQTLFAARGGGMYLKLAPAGMLRQHALMQIFYAEHGLSSALVCYCMADRDYLLVSALDGADGTQALHCASPERLSTAFGQALRRLHETDTADCPVRDGMGALLSPVPGTPFLQSHLDMLAPYIGAASALTAAAEIQKRSGLLQNDVVMHGDYCLPNIMLKDWALSGFIDLGGSGLGDRHYDLAWGLWTLCYNLKTPVYGTRFLDAYGRDKIDGDRLRVCGLLAAME